MSQSSAAALRTDALVHHCTSQCCGLWGGVLTGACVRVLARNATFLLFRDKKRQLHLYSIEGQNRSTLLNYCSYVQVTEDPQ